MILSGPFQSLPLPLHVSRVPKTQRKEVNETQLVGGRGKRAMN